MQGRAAGLASVLVLLTAFSVSRLQAQNEEIPVEQLLAEFKAITAQVGRLSVKVAALDARINALEKTAVPDPLAGIPLAEENRCTPYDADDYAYPLSVETEIVAAPGWAGASTAPRTLAAKPSPAPRGHPRPTLNISSPAARRMTAALLRGRRGHALGLCQRPAEPDAGRPGSESKPQEG